MSNAKKDALNPFFKKSYADLNSIREAIMPALNANGISVIQPTIVIDGVDYVETILLHESGEFISSTTKIVVDKVNDAQRHGSGLSYARRYALQSIVCIGAEDDDANLATNKQVIKPTTQPIANSNAEALNIDLMLTASSEDELKTRWLSLSKIDKTKPVEEAKNKRKAELTTKENDSNA